ncbi:MAG: tRNA (adenosine(37)-N6)-dimethylallyltransferase MiaA [Deltaproteobacteria bacterium]|nr:tRNA (adenosine(37)-N6)-dimethylallyltransferase MiaA [Deltaproteobacteria bacterium]
MGESVRVVVITGPTASGKSSMALKLASRFDAEIVNADSMQVYRGMDVGTAKLRPEERQGIPHHLLDVVDPDEAFHAALYRSHALRAIREIRDRRKNPFVVGGTGLYIRSLLGGLVACPPVDSALRDRLRRECDEQGPAVLHARLRELDPESAGRIHPNDRVRILRALEMMGLSRKPHSEALSMHAFSDRPFLELKICLQIEREELYHRINERCLRMFEEGLIEETKGLLRKGFSRDLKSMRSIGYRHVIRFLEGDWDYGTAVREMQTDTRRYAKRQLTWFRADPEMVWLHPKDEEAMATKIAHFLTEKVRPRDL